MPDPEIVHPTAEDGIDHLNHLSYRLADVLPEDFPEFGKKCRSLLQLGRKLRSPFLVTTQNQAILKSQECETSALRQIDYPALFLVDLDSEFG
jgi:hypothetical protein